MDYPSTKEKPNCSLVRVHQIVQNAVWKWFRFTLPPSRRRELRCRRTIHQQLPLRTRPASWNTGVLQISLSSYTRKSGHQLTILIYSLSFHFVLFMYTVLLRDCNQHCNVPLVYPASTFFLYIHANVHVVQKVKIFRSQGVIIQRPISEYCFRVLVVVDKYKRLSYELRPLGL